MRADKPATTVTFIPRTDAEVDNSRYEAKVPYEVRDDFGNAVTLYQKLPVDLASLASERESLVARIAEIDALVDATSKAVPVVK